MGHKNHKKKRVKYKNKPTSNKLTMSQFDKVVVQAMLDCGITSVGIGDGEVTLTYDICTDDEEEPTE